MNPFLKNLSLWIPYIESLSSRYFSLLCPVKINNTTFKGPNQGLRNSLEGEIVRKPGVSLSLTLNRNEKVEQHIRERSTNPLS